MDAKVTWHGRMSFTGISDSGFEIPLGTDPGVGGDNDGFRPMELMAISLAGCTAMDVISILAKKRQEITAYDVRVST
ncbi:MAG: OsmC family protein, partial [Anaerolineales bacterium]|nr:OsmC family protein [Anaerolineales bacterium]